MARKKLQKAFALLLTFSMSMSLLGVTAFADEPEAHTHNPVACPTCGGDHQIEVNVPCPDCGGTVAEVPMIDCATCDGTGTNYEVDWDAVCPINGPGCGGCEYCYFGFGLKAVTCEDCGGTGKVQNPSAEVCENCGGTGSVKQSEECPDCTDGTIPCTGSFAGAVTTPATCVSEGEMTYTCAACGASYTESIPVDGNAHQWGEPVAEEGKAPTCGADGSGIRTCALCEAEETVVMPATGAHTYGDDLKCSVCGAPEPADEDTAAAIALLEALPAAADVTADDQAAIEAARTAYNALSDHQKLFVTDELLARLTAAEEALAPALVARADSLLAALPADPAADLAATIAAYNAVSALTEEQKGQLAHTEQLAALNDYLAVTDLYSYFREGDSAAGAWVVYATTLGVAAPEGTSFSGNPATFLFVKGTSDLGKIGGMLPAGCTLDAAFQVSSALSKAAKKLADGEEITVMIQSPLTQSLSSCDVYFLSSTSTISGECSYVAETELSNGAVVIHLNNRNYQNLTYIALTRSIEYTDSYTTPDAAANSYVPADRAASSDGITYGYRVDGNTRVVTVTIPADYTGETVNVNMAVIREIFGELSVGLVDNGQVVSGGYTEEASLEGKDRIEPGQPLSHRIEIINLSSQKYAYTAGSLWLDAAQIAGYVGYGDATGTYPAFDGSEQTFAVYRTWNKALTALLDSKKDVLDDASINAALQAIYDNEEGIEVNLPHYYLDYYNFAYNVNVSALEQLPTDALFDLFGGERDVAGSAAGGVVYSRETLPELNNLAYNFFYTHGFQLEQSNSEASDYGTSVGAAMAGRYNVLDTKASAAWGGLNAATGTAATMEFTVTPSGPLWNAYMRYPIACDMGFTLTAVHSGGSDDPTPPGGGTEIPEGGTPTTELPEEETPTTEQPEEEPTELPEEETPLADVPKTGDLSALWLAMTALSGTGLASVTFLGRKKRDEE